MDGGNLAFEGRIETLLRPEAQVQRLFYALVVNLLVGVLGTFFVLRRYRSALAADPRDAGFGHGRRSLFWVAVGIVAGSAFYLLQGAPSTHPVVVLNGFSQVLTVSAAEVLVCWALVGRAVEVVAKPRGDVVSLSLAVLAASVLFGLYHFAHSAPFNSVKMVALLSVVGLVTSTFYFISRDVAGTLVFHNFLGTFGVVQALHAAGELAAFERLQLPLVSTALLTVALIASGYYWLRSAGPLCIGAARTFRQ